MRKILIGLLLLAASLVQAQTTVTATVVDTDGTAWANGSYTVTYLNAPAYPGPLTNALNGQLLSNLTGSLNSSGAMSVVVVPTASVKGPSASPSPGVSITVCPQMARSASNVACYSTGPIVISGSSQSVSTQINAVIVAPRVAGLSPLAQAYNDTEVAASAGNQYTRLSDGAQRCYSSGTWGTCGSGGGAPSGPAGGDLSGSYPNPTVSGINGVLLSGLATGLYKFTAGVPSAATAGTDYVIPSGNISGTAANLSGTPALPNGTTATEQAASDNSTKLATTSYVDRAAGGGSSYPFTFVQEAQIYTPSGTSSFTATFPQAAAASGNTLWMIIATDGSGAVSTPTGWTKDIDQAQASYSRLMVFHKASAADTSAAFTLPSSASMSIEFFEMVGSHSLDTSANGSVAGTPATISFPAITPTAGAVVFAYTALVTNTSAFFYTNPSFNPNWRATQVNGTASNQRILAGYVGTVAATATSTLPPQLNTNGYLLFSSGGAATVTFSIK